MKPGHFFLFALISIFLSISACKDTNTDAATETPTATTPEGAIGTQNPTLSTGASGSAEKHYKCNTAGCAGAGDAAGKCPVCGADLVHNTAFHNQSPGNVGSSPTNPVQVTPNNATTPTTTTANANPPAAKNAKGVYHYSCPKGHEGGSAIAANCTTCGEAMAHNQAYHE